MGFGLLLMLAHLLSASFRLLGGREERGEGVRADTQARRLFITPSPFLRFLFRAAFVFPSTEMKPGRASSEMPLYTPIDSFSLILPPSMLT